MVGAGRERSRAPTSARGGRGSSIPPHSLRRALDLSLQSPVTVASSSAGRGRGGKKKEKAARGGRGVERGRKAATPSSPPPPAESPDHRAASSKIEPSEVDPSRTPLHEPPADEPMADTPTADEPRAAEPRAVESSPHETPELRRGHAESEPSPWEDWIESSAHGCVQGGDYSPDSYSEGELVEGRKVYQHGRTKLPPTPATADQRWLIAPNGEK